MNIQYARTAAAAALYFVVIIILMMVHLLGLGTNITSHGAMEPWTWTGSGFCSPNCGRGLVLVIVLNRISLVTRWMDGWMDGRPKTETETNGQVIKTDLNT